MPNKSKGGYYSMNKKSPKTAKRTKKMKSRTMKSRTTKSRRMRNSNKNYFLTYK